MAEPFMSEIRLFSFAFAPKNWAQANGQLLPINQNQALFSLLGTTFGGDGRVNFGLPNMIGRVPIHVAGNQHTLGERGGEQSHTLTSAEMPSHNHVVNVDANTAASSNLQTPLNTHVLGQSVGKPPTGSTFPVSIYGSGAATNVLAPQSVASTGGSQAHQNMQPYLTLNYCIALSGIYPSRS